MDGFVHLHVHSHYSLLDGGNRIKDLLQTARSFGMDSLALTDHGNLFGAMDFYKEAQAAGVRPILGMEAYISPTTRQDRSMGNIQTAAYHLLLLAMNETGWHNLMKLSSRAYLEGFYYRPRIDRELLSQYSDGLICTTACLGGEVPSAILSDQPQRARHVAGEYLDIFGPERFFIEVQNQGIAEQDQANVELVKIARELGVGLVGTNDVHFLRRDDKPAHEVLTCISTGKTLSQDTKLQYPEELFLKSPEEMRQALSAWPEAADNTLRIAEMCQVDIDFGSQHLPDFQTPDGSSSEAYLRTLAWEGLRQRFDGEDVPEQYAGRLEREIQVIEDKGYSSYFLIVNDFVQHARQNSIPAAPRGSGVATLLGYSLGIADVDPLRYGLLFERFTDPQREEAPDIDIDLCQEGRGKIIQYVREKYGHVAQIITYGTLKARAVLRDVGRVMDIPLAEVDKIAKLVPDQLKMTLEKALEDEPELKKLYDADPKVKQLIDYGRRLEGLARHAGVHAAGVIVAQEPLENLVPLCRQADSEDAITQWDGPTCDSVGLMKMDFLGLRTLTILQRARDLVRERTGRDIDPEKLPLDDDEVYALFRRGDTDGVFQFESGGMKGVLMQIQPARIEELIAANAMYRPGPMELIPTYASRKHGREEIPSVHSSVDDILAETYGIMVYQEQVMQVLSRLGNLPLNRALTLIKAISKKKAKTIEAERPNFMEGAKANGISDHDAEELFALILKFAGYGFNKAHSTRYAIVAYQMAYFKVHYPREFLAATLTFECGDTDKVVQYMAEADRMGIAIAPPDINACGSDFAVDGEQVRFGLAAVKGVGGKAVEAIVHARKEVGRFKDLYHFCRHVDLRTVNRTTIEALIKCGAFDALGASRAAMMAAVDHALDLGQAAAADRRSGQMSFFDVLGGGEEPPARFPDVEPWSESQLLAAEKETLGFYITSHPLIRHGRALTSLTCPKGFTLAQCGEFAPGTPVTVGCMIAQVRTTVTRKSGKRMAMLTVEDLTGKCDAVVFPSTYDQISPFLVPEAMAFLRGSIDCSRERPNLIVEEFIPMDQAVEQLTGAIVLRFPGAGAPEELLSQVQEVLTAHKGNCPVLMEFHPSSRMDILTTVRVSPEWFVQPARPVVEALCERLGEENLVLTPRPMKPNGRNGRNGQRGWNGSRGGNGSARPPRPAAASSGPASAAVTRFN